MSDTFWAVVILALLGFGLSAVLDGCQRTEREQYEYCIEQGHVPDTCDDVVDQRP